MRQKRFWIVALMLLAIMLSVTPAPSAQAQGSTITVNTTVDGLNDGDGRCSLREAIQAANTNSAVDACTAGSGDDIINLPAGTYTLTLAGADEDNNATGDLDITDDLTINGAGADSTNIDGNRLDRVLYVHSGVAVEINGVKITNGKTPDGDYGPVGNGGGIYNSGTLTVNNSTISSNTTGHGYNAVFIGFGGDGGDGGGIYNSGTLMVINSTVSNNTTGYGGDGAGFPTRGGDGGDGGGIYNSGTLTVTSSTVSSNTTGHGGDGSGDFESGGGYGGDGGGIYNSGTLAVSNSTVSNNTTGNGGDGSGGDGEGGAGGGINHTNGTVKVKNTVIADNTDPDGQTPDCSGTLTSQGYNLVENITGCTIGGDTTANITGQDPKLSPLADNGGPTQTHALLPDSPAIDAGSCGAVTTDQRGLPRPVDIPCVANVDDGCDIGAYEAQEAVVHRVYLPLIFKN